LVSNDDIRQIIDNYIRGRNAERNREILKRRIIDGVTIEKLSEEFDMSVSQIKEIIFKNKAALKDRLP
jgi:DNA-directed RNA polymerase specialized sigma24 family protein